VGASSDGTHTEDSTMDCSPARLAANRANAARSTGPRTEEGKQRSRANAFKHGMAGEGIALPAEDQAEVMRVFAAIEAQLRPETDVDRALARRVALLTIRLGRCAAHDAAATSARVLSAGSDFDEARLAEVDRLMADLDADPAASVRQLRRTPEGVDRMVAAWRALEADVTCRAEDRWGAAHRELAENLTGRRPGEVGLSRVEALARAIRGDFTLLTGDDAAGEDRARSARARERMAGLIDAEVAGLLAHRETLDLGLIASRRALAAGLALFDASKEAQLARRYEAASERGLYRALREIRQGGQAERPRAWAAEAVASPVALATAELLGSFRAAEASGLLGAPAVERRRPDPSRSRPKPPSRRERRAANALRDASSIVVGRG